MIKKNPKADLRSSHTILVQFGIICSLLCFIAATNIEIKPKVTEPPLAPKSFTSDTLISLPPTIPPKKPAPHIPNVLNPVPDDFPIEPDPIEFMEFGFGDSIPLPPKPTSTPTDEFELTPEIMPEMKGGVSKLYSEINYPKQARNAAIEGRVIVQYIVNQKGEVENPEIIRGIGGGCDEEVLRAIKLMSFTPGIQNGRFVKVKMNQMITFRLQN